VPATGLTVNGDGHRLEQVISNLLNNAAKYTEPGGIIQISAEAEGGDVVVRVRDTGVGIEHNMLPRIFDLFAQERQSLDRSRGGLGIGLALVRSIVHLHGGSVAAASGGKGQGSLFTVRLPAMTGAATPRAATPGDVTTTGQLLAGRVLIVDDNRDAAVLLGELLETYGCQTVIAHDGPSALAATERFVPEIAILDIGLPVMDGYELAGHLRRDPRLAGVRLIAVTGYGQTHDRERSRDAGFDAHLVKPVSDARLRDALSQSRIAADHAKS
jgi:CheY-like chemotaxis protein